MPTNSHTEIQALTTYPAAPIGQYWPGQGGINAGLFLPEPSLPPYWIIVATSDAEYAEWGFFDQEIAGADSSYDGKANTTAILTAASALGFSDLAAHRASEYRADGHADFFLPARRELALCTANVPYAFTDGWYWSSSQYSSNNAWCQYSGGNQGWLYKDVAGRVRAVRRIQLADLVI